MSGAKKMSWSRLTIDQKISLSIRALTDREQRETLKKIAPDYSMFRLIVNMVAEKSLWVEDL